MSNGEAESFVGTPAIVRLAGSAQEAGVGDILPYWIAPKRNIFLRFTLVFERRVIGKIGQVVRWAVQ